jgi:hypothetical protein
MLPIIDFILPLWYQCLIQARLKKRIISKEVGAKAVARCYLRKNY